MVTIVPHRGAVVSVLWPDEIGELFDLRVLVEPDLIRRAVPHMAPEDLRQAEDRIRRYKAALEQRDVEASGRLETRASISPSIVRPEGRALSPSPRRCSDQTDRYTRMQLLLTGGQSQAQQANIEALLAACRGGGGRRKREA